MRQFGADLIRYSPTCAVLTDPKRRKQLMAFGDAYRTMPSTVSLISHPPHVRYMALVHFRVGICRNWPRGIISYSCLPALMLSDS